MAGTSRSTAVTIAAGDLSLLAGGTPPAVLLVDSATRRVVYTSPVAQELAPDVTLPVTVDEWSDAAVLRDADGRPLSETTHPLSRVARALPVAGQAVSAERSSGLGRRREPLWVIALPMANAPGLPDHALVIFLPLDRQGPDGAAADAARAQVQLRERAVLATALSFVVADARAPDVPLVWVNPAFTAATGYSFDESVGRNCRFLQGPATDPAAVAELREAVRAGGEVATTLLNYRKDGTAFWNQLAISPVHAPDGTLTHLVGIQTDVTARVAADVERERALAAERDAHRDAEAAREDAEAARGEAERAVAAAERSRRRLELLVEATTELSGTLDVTACRDRLVDLVVPRLADWALVVGSTRTGAVSDVTARHRDPARAADLAERARALRHSPVPGPLQQVLLGGAPFRRLGDDDSAQLGLGDARGAASVLVVPLPARRDSRDVLVLVRDGGSPRHTDDDLDVALDLGRRAGLILDNARLYEEQHRIAATLQLSLLPVLPAVDGLQVAARYRASESGAQVGGDFYELIDLPGDAVGLAVGDVVGHDVLAAAAMGHLRGLLRASAWDPADPSPAAVVDRVDQLLLGLGLDTMATMAYARLSPAGAGGWQLEQTSAGHPPLLVRDPGGRTRFLDVAHDLMLGAQLRPRTTTRHHLPAGSSLLAYTDGLVERRGEVLATGLERLRTEFAQAPDGIEEQCDHLLSRLGGSDDDVAFLLVHL